MFAKVAQNSATAVLVKNVMFQTNICNCSTDPSCLYPNEFPELSLFPLPRIPTSVYVHSRSSSNRSGTNRASANFKIRVVVA